jgi:manganese transport protein
MLITASATFFRTGQNVGTLEQAYRTLQPLLGPAAGVVFGVALLASGLSSSSVGTMAGQVIMQGFLHFHIAPWIRRLVTIIPSLIVIFLGFDPTRTLVISQVVLSFGLPFAVIPLIMFTSNKNIMGGLVNKRSTTFLAGLSAVVIISLNFFLIYNIMFGN